MITHALLFEKSPVKLWGLSSRERIGRQLKAIGGVELIKPGSELPTSGGVLLLNGHFLFEIRTLAGLLQRQNTVLTHPGDGRIAAVVADAGMAAGWIMTFLDTVDGKLARVTVQSSKFGHLFDHLTDLFHPPFWYIFWGISLSGFQPVMGLDQVDIYWIIVIGYVAGLMVEGLFPLPGNCNAFTWRPFDAYFRLVGSTRGAYGA